MTSLPSPARAPVAAPLAAVHAPDVGAAAACFAEVDPATGPVTAFRDDVDLGAWRARPGGVLER
jgi:hypothetical protein